MYRTPAGAPSCRGAALAHSGSASRRVFKSAKARSLRHEALHGDALSGGPRFDCSVRASHGPPNALRVGNRQRSPCMLVSGP